MSDLIREAPLGQLIRWITKNRVLQYPEEKADFELPEAYKTALNSTEKSGAQDLKKDRPSASSDDEAAKKEDPDTESESKSAADVDPYATDVEGHHSRLSTTPDLAPTPSIAIVPTKTNDGHILVTWYDTTDPSNPQNWSLHKKNLISLLICLYTFVVYSGSAIVTSSSPFLITTFHISATASSLPLALYVLAYGIGPLLWAPLSEIPIIGRSPIYAITFFLFTILSIPTVLATNFAGLLVLRFLQGFFGSPCLAIGAASLQDMYSLLYLPFALTAWVSAAYCGPALGPLLSGFAVTAEGWRWSLWEILWAAGPILILMVLLLPETSTPTILLRRAARLRKLTGDGRLMAQSEIDQHKMTARHIAVDALIKPMEITVKDPAIGFVNLYTALVYGIYYSFFEVFPLVYEDMYGFSLGMIGVVFTCVLIACAIGVATYLAYLKWYLIPDILKNGLREQESQLVPALFCTFGLPIGLFLFAWTSRESVSWVVPTIGIVIYGASTFVLMQCIFVYVPLSYPQYAASLFAANDFLRSALACGSILWSGPLFGNLGVGKGTSVLGGLSTLGIVGMFALWIFGGKLRARSKFAIA